MGLFRFGLFKVYLGLVLAFRLGSGSILGQFRVNVRLRQGLFQGLFTVDLGFVWGSFRLGLGFIQVWFNVKLGFRQGLCEAWFRASVRSVLGFIQFWFEVYGCLVQGFSRFGLRLNYGFAQGMFRLGLGYIRAFRLGLVLSGFVLGSIYRSLTQCWFGVSLGLLQVFLRESLLLTFRFPRGSLILPACRGDRLFVCFSIMVSLLPPAGVQS